MPIIYSLTEYEEAHGTRKGYLEQFPNTAKPEVGKRYAINPGKWDERVVQVLFADDRVALSVEVVNPYPALNVPPGYWLHSATTGWRYNDNRPQYRLQNIPEKPHPRLAEYEAYFDRAEAAMRTPLPFDQWLAQVEEKP